jgi:DNA-directed RNA polymerase subunit RPC12/RpoP
MVMYKCLNPECPKEVDSQDVKRRVRCPYCGSKILAKQKNTRSVVAAI